jgi:hypothetical protein
MGFHLILRGRVLAALLGAVGLLLVGGCASQSTARPASLSPSPSCFPASRLFGPRPASPQALSTDLPAAILARYALFRRPAQRADAPPPKALVGRTLARELVQDFTLASWYPAEVRKLEGPTRAARYYVIPAFGRREAVPSSCRPARARRELVAQQRRRLTEPVVCVIAVGAGGSTPGDCKPFAASEAEADVFASGGRIDPIVSLVPDGVTWLRISYRSRPPMTVPVAGNALVFTPPPLSRHLRALQDKAMRLDAQWGGCYRTAHAPLVCGNPHLTKAQNHRLKNDLDHARAAYQQAAAANDPTQIDWLDAAGRVVRTLAPPTPAQLAATSVGNLRAPISG